MRYEDPGAHHTATCKADLTLGAAGRSFWMPGRRGLRGIRRIPPIDHGLALVVAETLGMRPISSHETMSDFWHDSSRCDKSP